MQLNPLAQVRVESVANIPILYIENFYADPVHVRESALGARYDISIAGYPGRHAVISSSDLQPVATVIAEIASRLGDRLYRSEDFSSDFSVVTTRPGDLLPAQQHPHIDPTPVLGLVYLTPESREGTSFYFNEYLGVAVLVSEEHQKAHVDFMERHGAALAPGGYNFDRHPAWRKIYTIEPIFNRFVLYPGNVFHAIDVKHVDDEIDISRARVTQRFIVGRVHNK